MGSAPKRASPLQARAGGAAVLDQPVSGAWPRRANRPLGLRLDLLSRDCATVDRVTYLDELAAEIERRVPQEFLPEEDTKSLFRLYAVLVLAKGVAVDAVDVHNAWAAWMQERDPDHRSIKQFQELDDETQASDEPFVEAIRAVAERLDRTPA